MLNHPSLETCLVGLACAKDGLATALEEYEECDIHIDAGELLGMLWSVRSVYSALESLVYPPLPCTRYLIRMPWPTTLEMFEALGPGDVQADEEAA